MNKCLQPFRAAVAAFFCTIVLAGAADAAVVISKDPTQNMNCSAGVCTPTANEVVLNVADLANLLAAGDVKVVADSAATDISFAAPFSWTSASGLTLDSYRAIAFQQPVSDAGPGALTLTTNDGGADGQLSFGRKGSISFLGTANTLTIDGHAYKLAASIAELAANIAARPHGFHALANNYDASADGSYSHLPIPTEFGGTFDGLGNAISNFSMYDTADNYAALFKSLKRSGILRNIRLLSVNILGENTFNNLDAPLLGYNAGLVLQCQATGAIRSDFKMTGGGLVAISYGTVQKSFADVYVSGAQDAEVGGLIGNAHGRVSDVYATGRVIAGDQSAVGGLIGYFIGKLVTRGYATGQVSGGQNAIVGGLVGENQGQFSNGKITHSYWDTETSGATEGAGSGDGSGIAGLTTEELQSGIPHDFDAAVWAEQRKVNNGLPYLLANPPPK